MDWLSLSRFTLELREALEARGGSSSPPPFFFPPFYNLQSKSYGWEAPSMDALFHDLLHPDVSVLEKIIRPILVYLFLVVSLRLAGKRELAQLNPFDLVVLLTLSNAVQNAIIGNDNSVTGGIVGATTLLVINYIVVRFLYSHERLDRLVEGDAELLIENGKVC